MKQGDALNMIKKINEINHLVVQLDLENKCLKQKIKAWEKLCLAQNGLLRTSKELDYILNKKTIEQSTDANMAAVEEFCIKPEVKKQAYRISMIRYANGKIGIGVSQSEDEENTLIEMKEFVCWLTDRVEYELPEEKV